MKYLIFLILISIAYSNESDFAEIKEISLDDFFKSEKKVIQFKSSDGKISPKYDCVELVDFIKNKNKFIIEVISDIEKAKIITTYEVCQNSFYPILILNENKKKKEYKKQIQDLGNASFDYSEIDEQIDAAVDKIIELPYDLSILQEKTVVFLNATYEVNYYSNIQKIIFYEN